MKIEKLFFICCEIDLPKTFKMEMQVKKSFFDKFIKEVSSEFPIHPFSSHREIELNGVRGKEVRTEYRVNDFSDTAILSSFYTVVGYTVKFIPNYNGKHCSFHEGVYDGKDC